MPGFPVQCSLFRFSDIFRRSMWKQSSDCPGGEGGGDLNGSLGRDVPPRHQTLTLFETKIAHFGHFATPL